MSKDEEVAETMNCFFDQFGFMDVYTQIVLEEFFRELFNESDLRVSGEKGQEGDKGNI